MLTIGFIINLKLKEQWYTSSVVDKKTSQEWALVLNMGAGPYIPICLLFGELM